MLELSGARKHSTGCWGFILFSFFFLFFSPSCTPWAGGWVAASAVDMGGKKLPSGCTHVSAIIEKEPPKNKWGGEGQAGGELLAGAAAA